MKSREIGSIMYERGYHDGLISGKAKAAEAYVKMLMDMSPENAVIELIGSFEKERIINVYKAWHDIYHYVSAMSELLETEHLTAVTSELWDGIKAEVTDRYLAASDDYNEAKYADEEFADRNRKEAK